MNGKQERYENFRVGALRENLLKEGKLLDDTTRLQARAMSQLNEHVT